MEKMKETNSQIEEIKKLLKTFDDGFEKNFVSMKKSNLKNLKRDIENYQKDWRKTYNEDLHNKNSKTKNLDMLKFEPCDLLKSTASEMPPINPDFTKKGKKKRIN